MLEIIAGIEFVVIVVLAVDACGACLELKATRENLKSLMEASKALIKANDDLQRSAEKLLAVTKGKNV